jgi:subtilisin family serine protease
VSPAPTGRASAFGTQGLLHLFPIALLTLAAACGGDDGPTDIPVPHATKLAVLTQPPTQAQSGIAFSSAPVVQLQDDQGASVAQAGVSVTVSIGTGGGSLTGTSTVNTSSDGRATFTGLAVRGTIGPRTLTFSAPDLTAISSETIDLSAGVAAVITPHEGDQQAALAGTAVAVPPSVTITDADNNRVSGVPVTFQVTAGAGSVDPTTAVNTNENGIAAVTSWTLGATAGPNTLTATAAGLTGSSVAFTAMGSAPLATIEGTITVSRGPLAGPSRTEMLASPTRSRLDPPKLLLTGRELLRGWGLKRSPRPASTRQVPEYTPDELIVTFRPTALRAPPVGSRALASRSTAGAVSTEIRSRVAPHLLARGAALTGVSPAVMAARIRVLPAAIEQVGAELRRDPAVAAVTRNGFLSRAGTGWHRKEPTKSSNDPLAAYQAWNQGLIDLPEAWSMTTGSGNVLVAVVDDGMRFDHPGIAANLTSDGYDFVSSPLPIELCSGGSIDLAGDGDGYDSDPTIPESYDYDDDAQCAVGPQALGNHGLYVAGIIGAVGNDGVGTAGINWAVRIRPVRVLGVIGRGTEYDVAQGILYAAGLPADDGVEGVVQAPSSAQIINLSLGGTEVTGILEDAVIAASNAGSLLIASAGNSASSEPQYPAAYPQVVSVSAVGPDRELASYASFGATIDIAAPGGDVADGDLSFGVLSTLWDFSTGEAAYGIGEGTSAATPHVSGVAGLLLAQSPGLTASQLRSRLTSFAVDAGSPGDDNRYGAGIVNARNSLAGNLGPAHQLRARLYDALTGSTLQSVGVSADGSYSFPVGDGSYHVFAGQDEDGDQKIGVPGRRWGAFGGAATASLVRVDGPGTKRASFAIDSPAEDEPNADFDDANLLPLAGYLQGTLTPSDKDVLRVLIPEAGQYTLETSAVNGACGFALEDDTVLRLYDPNRSLLTDSDDIDEGSFNFCSRITATLQPGAHYLEVRGLNGGRYRVQARSGP